MCSSDLSVNSVNVGKNLNETRDAVDFLSRNPNLPELRFLFRQIRDCRAEGAAKLLYMEGKILEALSLIALNFERRAEAPHLAVTLDSQDRRGLKRVVAAMAKDPALEEEVEVGLLGVGDLGVG